VKVIQNREGEMKAEELKEIVFIKYGVDLTDCEENNFELLCSKEWWIDIYNSLKEFEELEAKKQPKYRLTRDVPSIGLKKEEANITLEFNESFGADMYIVRQGSKAWFLPKDLIDKSLIEEVKLREFWVNEYKSGGFSEVHKSRESAIKASKGAVGYVGTFKFIQVRS